MLSGEGNPGERWKTTTGLISKNVTLHVQHTFLYISLSLFCTTTTWNVRNFLHVTRYTFFRFRTCLVRFFFTAAHFHLALVAGSTSPFVTPATKFSCCSSNEKRCLLCFFISRSRSLSPFFSLSFAGLPPTFSFSLSFSCSIFQIFGHGN